MLFRQGNRLINSRNWAKLVRPEQIVCDSDPNDTMYGKFTYEPLERGYGVTIGNALRRVLLSSLQGAAFVAVKISGVQHEFTTIPGVLEDITDVILNIKQVRLGMTTDEPQHLTLSVSKKGPVTAADIMTNANVEVLNPELHIATLTEDMVRAMCPLICTKVFLTRSGLSSWTRASLPCVRWRIPWNRPAWAR